MKRVLLYSIILAATFVIPQHSTDIGKLQPVEVVLLDMQDENVLLKTDTNDWGRGNNIDAALRNLRATTSGEIFLDTADYLIVTEKTIDIMEEIKQYLDGSVRVCVGTGTEDLEEAAKYLAVHKPKIRLDKAGKEAEMQKMTANGGRLYLSK